MDFSVALARADTLASRHRAAAEVLFFFRAVARFQMEIYHRARAPGSADPQRLDTAMLASFVPDFLQLVEKYGPRELSEQAAKFRDRQDWEGLLRSCWMQSHDRLDLLSRTILQPYVQHLAERWHVEVGIVDNGTGACPFCSRGPLLGVSNGRRTLHCSLCAHEWEYPERTCPGCHGQRIDVLRLRSVPNVHVEACESCGHYLKGVELRRDPSAVPVVDELAAVELDKLAREKGFTKFELNLAGQ
jgi:hypothetical protein